MKIDNKTCSMFGSGQGGVWAYVSSSRLGKWLSCPLAYRFQYVEGIRPPTTPSQFVGKMVHRTLEVFYRHRQLGVAPEPQDIIGRLGALWEEAVDDEKMKFASSAEEAALQDQAAGLLRAYMAHGPPHEKPDSGRRAFMVTNALVVPDESPQGFLA